jgi:hypothetical protein
MNKFERIDSKASKLLQYTDSKNYNGLAARGDERSWDQIKNNGGFFCDTDISADITGFGGGISFSKDLAYAKVESAYIANTYICELENAVDMNDNLRYEVKDFYVPLEKIIAYKIGESGDWRCNTEYSGKYKDYSIQSLEAELDYQRKTEREEDVTQKKEHDIAADHFLKKVNEIVSLCEYARRDNKTLMELTAEYATTDVSTIKQRLYTDKQIMAEYKKLEVAIDCDDKNIRLLKRILGKKCN